MEIPAGNTATAWILGVGTYSQDTLTQAFYTNSYFTSVFQTALPFYDRCEYKTLKFSYKPAVYNSGKTISWYPVSICLTQTLPGSISSLDPVQYSEHWIVNSDKEKTLQHSPSARAKAQGLPT